MTQTTQPVASPEPDLVQAEPERPAQAGVDERVLNPQTVTAAAFLASCGAAWVVGGVFADVLVQLTAVGATVLGAAIVMLSWRTSRPALVQLLVVPAALVVAALLVLPDSGGDLGELPGFVSEALRSGGLSTPPVPFDPGWRIVLVLLCMALVATSATLAVSFALPRLGVLIPLVVIVGGMLVQPERRETATALVALALALAGLGVSYGVQLSRQGATSGRFEVRRLVRAGAVVAVLSVALVGLGQIGFLFPAGTGEQVLPPRRPGVPPPQEASVLFTVREPAGSDHVWRTGVLDVYGVNENAWLTPPYDPERLVELPESGRVPNTPSAGSTSTATVTVGDGGGRALPVMGSPAAVRGTAVDYDPRTQTFQAAGRLAEGTRYTVTFAAADRARLAEAPPPPAAMADYVQAPPVPPLVQQLLLTAPPASGGLFARLEHVRTKLYENVVAQGVGSPSDVSPERAQEIIVHKGTKATPYEITAADALLARWVGVPARVGYGYYTAGKQPGKDGVVEIAPQDGATWLEIYAEDTGWVPVPKTPKRTPPPVDQAPKSQRPDVSASEDRALLVYVPVRVQTVRLAYQVVGYWALVTLPWVLAALLVWMWYPAVLKVLRRGRRRRWALARGHRERIAVAYSDLRDVANDFGVGHPTQTPIEFLDAVGSDTEHRELAWLVTRALWGDLRRDLRIDDAEAAEDLARSVRKRLARAQSPIVRMLAGVSRVSLKDPYSNEIPNFWPRRRHPLRALGTGLRAGKAIHRPATAMVLTLVMIVLTGGCATVFVRGQQSNPGQAGNPKVPEMIQEYALLRSPSAEQPFHELARESLVTDARVYEIYDASDRQALLQIAWLKPGLDDVDEAKRQILASIESGKFTFSRIGEERAYVKQLPDLKIVVWFAPGDRYYQLIVARKQVAMTDLDRLVKGLLAFQREDRHQIVNVPEAPKPPNPLLGSAG